jgi:hypothetical protein
MSVHKVVIFQQVPLFAGLAPWEIESLAARAMEKRYPAGQVLFREGEPCSGLFLIAQGSVKIYKTPGTGREIMLAIEAAPSSVAEVPPFDGEPYPATVNAVDAGAQTRDPAPGSRGSSARGGHRAVTGRRDLPLPAPTPARDAR